MKIRYQKLLCYHNLQYFVPINHECLIYRIRPIKSRGLYIFYSIFTSVYIVERLVLQAIYALLKEILQLWGQNPRFIIESDFKSRAGYNGARTVD